MKRLFSYPLLGLALAALLLAACGPAQNGGQQPVDATLTAAITPTEALPTTTAVASPQGEASPVPGMPDKLCAQPPTVIEFSVWQDFMPIVPRDGAHLHAALILEMQCPPGLTPADIRGSITIRRADGTEILAATLQVNELEDAATSGVKRISVYMESAPPPMTLTEGEMVSGTAILNVGQQQVEIQLPETPLQFTH